MDNVQICDSYITRNAPTSHTYRSKLLQSYYIVDAMDGLNEMMLVSQCLV
jgi:hypothetical protein